MQLFTFFLRVVGLFSASYSLLLITAKVSLCFYTATIVIYQLKKTTEILALETFIFSFHSEDFGLV